MAKDFIVEIGATSVELDMPHAAQSFCHSGDWSAAMLSFN
jgi:hypothetical protein